MTYSKSVKIVWGILSFIPLIGGIVFIAIGIIWFPEGVFEQEKLANHMEYAIFTILHVVVLTAMFIDFFYYMAVVYKNYEISRVWYLILCAGNVISFPIFWYSFIWRALEKEDFS